MKNLTDKELFEIISTNKYDQELFKKADLIRREHYGTDVYIRGLIEFTNYCKNNCFYCGIRAGNHNTLRYRLTKDEIMDCCHEGYSLGFRTFVLQGGEDPYYTDEKMCDIVYSIREKYPDCAITLSIGEKSKESYKAYFSAGANRYLLRHETATAAHYSKLHPSSMSLDTRKECLYNLKEIGYQVGSGFMVGSPYQTVENLIADLRFLETLSPDMIGIGPYMTHSETPFASMPSGSLDLTLRMLSILRIMFPYALLPATTALGSIHPEGRELGLKAGANVVMPNLSPIKNREHYDIYENKIATGLEAAQNVKELKEKFARIGYNIVTDRGDVKR